MLLAMVRPIQNVDAAKVILATFAIDFAFCSWSLEAEMDRNNLFLGVGYGAVGWSYLILNKV